MISAPLSAPPALPNLHNNENNLIPLEDPHISGYYILSHLSDYQKQKKSRKEILARYLLTPDAVRKTKTQIARLFGVSQPYVSTIAKAINKKPIEYEAMPIKYHSMNLYDTENIMPLPPTIIPPKFIEKMILENPVPAQNLPQENNESEFVEEFEIFSNYLDLLKNISRDKNYIFAEIFSFKFFDEKNQKFEEIDFLVGILSTKILFFEKISENFTKNNEILEKIFKNEDKKLGIICKISEKYLKYSRFIEIIAKTCNLKLVFLKMETETSAPTSLIIDFVGSKIDETVREEAKKSGTEALTLVPSFSNEEECINFVEEKFKVFDDFKSIYAMALITTM